MGTYLITGGAGFIGSHLAEALLGSGHRVFSIDDLSTGSISNIIPLKEKYREMFVHDTVALEDAEQLVAERIDASDAVFHLAAAVGVKLVVSEPVRTLETNVRGTEIVLKYAVKKKKRTIITSTSEVYGKGGTNGSFKEDGDLFLGPSHNSRWGYAVSKLFDEHLALAYNREKKLPVTVIRLFNTVGPRQVGDYGMVIPRFITAALNNKPIEVYGSGAQCRCFCYVKDVVKALIKVIDCDESIGQIYNIGNNQEISIIDLANLIKKKLNSSSDIVLVPYKKAYEEGFEDMMKRVPDISKIQSLIGWKSETDLEQIIDLTSEWIRDDLQKNN